MELQALMALSAASHRTSEKSHSQDGTKTIGQINRELQEVHDRQPATARCAWCPWTFDGTAAEARDAFAFHKSSVHPERVNGKSTRELLDAMDRGESVAAERFGPAVPPRLGTSSPAKGPEAVAESDASGRARRTKWTREEIIEAIKRWAEERGAPPTVSDWQKKVEGYPTCSTVSTYCGSWADGIEAAGFPRPTRGGSRTASADPPPGCREAAAQAASAAEGAGGEASRTAGQGRRDRGDRCAGRGRVVRGAVRARGGATRNRCAGVPADRGWDPDARGAREVIVISDALVVRAQTGDTAASAEVVRLMLDDTLRIARSGGYFMRGGERADVEQEALFGVLRAIRYYRAGDGHNFRPFALMCIRRWLIYTCHRRPNKLNARPLNEAARIGVGEDGDEVAIVELVEDPRADIVDLLSARADLSRMARVVASLSPLERRALIGFARGFTYAELEGCADSGHVKQIDNALQRARRKIRDELQEAA